MRRKGANSLTLFLIMCTVLASLGLPARLYMNRTVINASKIDSIEEVELYGQTSVVKVPVKGTALSLIHVVSPATFLNLSTVEYYYNSLLKYAGTAGRTVFIDGEEYFGFPVRRPNHAPARFKKHRLVLVDKAGAVSATRRTTKLARSDLTSLVVLSPGYYGEDALQRMKSLKNPIVLKLNGDNLTISKKPEQSSYDHLLLVLGHTKGGATGYTMLALKLREGALVSSSVDGYLNYLAARQGDRGPRKALFAQAASLPAVHSGTSTLPPPPWGTPEPLLLRLRR